jgi:hypothetical protein
MRRSARSCAAVALGGWILISPPLREHAGLSTADLDAPETAWTHVSMHGTLEECEAARSAIHDQTRQQNLDVGTILRRERADHEAGKPPNPALGHLLALELARCVPAERLKLQSVPDAPPAAKNVPPNSR